ncbi:hypothetical protein [Rhizosaccharibacter radicis]|uniref:Uncharacterized protein n=1 Tax=Rhizosaccharibacter radicis TaxID=2782605 RepID=A0ABT1VZN3_9PROT|nr:hypothetical protein [Acetobacteraceae bacterium KSS12]
MFTDRADPTATTTAFDHIAATLPAALGVPHPVENVSRPGPDGLKAMKVLVGVDGPGPKILSTLMPMTVERPGGAFQATMQLGWPLRLRLPERP